MVCNRLIRYSSLCFAVFALCGRATAAQPTEQLLPATTKAFFSTPNLDAARKAFDQTQLGEMFSDPVMKPFIEDVQSQVREKLERAGKKLGLAWGDLEGVYAGEVAYAQIQPDAKDKLSHATVLIVDITGKQAEAKQLLAKIDANQKKNRAVRSTAKLGGADMTVFTLPVKEGEKVAEKSFYFIKGDQLIAADHQAVATAIASKIGGTPGKDTLAGVKAFEQSMQRNTQAAEGTQQHVRWFVEPLGYAEVNRAMQGGRKKRGTDFLKIFQTQGFTAVQGLGGYIFFDTNDTEILHRTLVYAPGPYDLAMRMLDFPNSAAPTDLEPQSWALSDAATYLTFNWKMKDAFNYAETLVDAIAGDKGVFKEIWLSLKSDPNGPKIDIYKGLVDQLGTRANLISDISLPVNVKSERMMVLLDIKDAATVAKTVEQAFKSDPQAKKRTFRGQTIWEITQEEGVAEAAELKIEGTDFVAAQEPESNADEDSDEAKLPNMAITVFMNHLVVSTHLDFIEDLVVRSSRSPNLGGMDDFQRVQVALDKLGGKNDSFRFFARTDESYRATFELLKQGKLPEAETMLARILNGLLGPQEEGVVRKQELDGSRLPDFELVKKYLGPSGLYAQTENEGWWVVGCLLKKE